MKGIILAGGSGTRLYPLTQTISKQLLPIYDKPMIYYPLSILMLSGITDILIITTPEDNMRFINLLRDGTHLGINISYEIQEKPNGLPEAFIIGKDFIKDDRVCLILGDNIFHADTFINKHVIPNLEGNTPTVFGYNVNDPERYGVVEFDKNQKVISIEEKPTKPKSNYAITGLYIFNNDVVNIAKELKPSIREETEIVDILKYYLKEKNLKVELLGRGVSWLDTGTHHSLHEASTFVEVLENRQGLKIACLEEIAYDKGYINKNDLIKLAEPMKKNEYGKYLLRVANGS
ncbi:glucose-1-phosphate thymidylyltransferase RfbA [Arcobacter sp. KX21116]|uniref:glucose-1-phosphate thymidylyltransferase RfbA n=1 Tax=Arcobacter iocasae TaxID=2906515 RepID=UPI0035D445AE